MRGREAEIWDKDEDMIATSTNKAEQDSFTKLIADKMVPWYHRWWGFRLRVVLAEACADLGLNVDLSRDIGAVRTGTDSGITMTP